MRPRGGAVPPRIGLLFSPQLATDHFHQAHICPAESINVHICGWRHLGCGHTALDGLSVWVEERAGLPDHVGRLLGAHINT
jgi:hypothetical protein